MLLTATITAFSRPSHHVLASRALIRARLQDSDAALVDAKKVLVVLIPRSLTLTLIYTKAIKIRPSIIAYIAKSLAHVGNEERHKAYRTCDIAFEYSRSSHTSFLLLIKVRIFSTRSRLHRSSHLRLSSYSWLETTSMR